MRLNADPGNDHDQNVDLPRLLIVSNNPFSATQNNGKTLASFFRDYPRDKVAQLYFSPENPSGMPGVRYFQVAETQLLRHPLGSLTPGSRRGDAEPSNRESGEHGRLPVMSARLYSALSGFQLARIAREVLWLRRDVRMGPLAEWLSEVKPDLIFFCAGDSLFAYSLVRRIRQRHVIPLATYVTDDYVLPRLGLSPLSSGRRMMVRHSLRKILAESALFFTISPKMKSAYRSLFGSDSELLVNLTEIHGVGQTASQRSGALSVVYAGALHSGRAQSLVALAKGIEGYNRRNPDEREAKLTVYTGTKMSRATLQALQRSGVCQIEALLPRAQYEEVIREADILVHVESFANRAVAVTRLSLSTKIPEYLSVGKPILAIGPPDIASMEVLDRFAECVTDFRELPHSLERLLGDGARRELLADAAREGYRTLRESTVSSGQLFHYLELAANSDSSDCRGAHGD